MSGWKWVAVSETQWTLYKPDGKRAGSIIRLGRKVEHNPWSGEYWVTMPLGVQPGSRAQSIMCAAEFLELYSEVVVPDTANRRASNAASLEQAARAAFARQRVTIVKLPRKSAA